jgi:hypothetical protein
VCRHKGAGLHCSQESTALGQTFLDQGGALGPCVRDSLT